MERFLDPKTLARIKDLPLVAKTVAEGFLHGLQPSMQRGVGIEFSQYRAYENGDELSRVDWKLFARSDRYFVREAERESEIDVWFLLDSSRSMQQKSFPEKRNHTAKKADSRTFLDEGASDKRLSDTPAWSKLDYAKHLIASIAYLAQKQGDSIGLLGMSSESVDFLSTGGGISHWQKLIMRLNAINYGQFFSDLTRLTHHLNYLQKQAIIFVISDFNQHDNEIVEFMAKLNTSRCEVVAIQLVCNDEINFNYKGAVRFKDLETEEEILVSAEKAKNGYFRAYQTYQQKLREDFVQLNISHSCFNIEKPLDFVLFEYLKQRNRARR